MLIGDFVSVQLGQSATNLATACRHNKKKVRCVVRRLIFTQKKKKSLPTYCYYSPAASLPLSLTLSLSIYLSIYLCSDCNRLVMIEWSNDRLTETWIIIKKLHTVLAAPSFVSLPLSLCTLPHSSGCTSITITICDGDEIVCSKSWWRCATRRVRGISA